MKISLEKYERELLMQCSENYYEDEVAGSTTVFNKIKPMLKSGELNLTLKDAKVLYECLNRDIHDMLNHIDFPDDTKKLESINEKINILLMENE